jgi:DNA-binding transcriptional LysR family regulator
MTFEQLRIFVAVAEHEHVTRAARELNLTQSATSAAVAALESRYAILLFDRVGRQIRLTAAGRLFLAEAKAVLARTAAAELVLADLAGLRIGSLSLAASQTVGNYWLPGFIHAFRRAYPGIKVSLVMGNTQTVASLVREGQANIGFVEGEIDEPSLSISIVAEDEIALVVPVGHPWEKMQEPDIDLRTARWVLREEGSGTRSILTGMLHDTGIDISELDIAAELPTNETVRAIVEAGAGVTVMSKMIAESGLATGKLATVNYPLPRRSFFMLRHKDRYRTRAEDEFVRLVSAT